jgi:rare lipoprotein A
MVKYCLRIVLSLNIFIVIGCVSSPRFTASKETSAEIPVLTSEEGIASYYAEEFDGRRTSNGEIYDMNKFTAAHRTLPFNTEVRVVNLASGKNMVVRINDRGPFKDNRIIDLSYAAAKALEVVGSGTTQVRLEVVHLGDTTGIPQHYAR